MYYSKSSADSDLNRFLRRCSWGKVVTTHNIGPYVVVEYKEHVLDGPIQREPKEYKAESTFHPFVDGRDTRQAFPSLETALLHAFAIKARGDTHAARYAAAVLGL